MLQSTIEIDNYFFKHILNESLSSDRYCDVQCECDVNRKMNLKSQIGKSVYMYMRFQLIYLFAVFRPYLIPFSTLFLLFGFPNMLCLTFIDEIPLLVH